METEPVAWRAIEQGWSFVDADGNEIGTVDQITGDLDGDIFDGITVGDGGTVYTSARYVPSEHVARIARGEVALDIAGEDVAKLERYHPPVSEPLADLAPQPEPSADANSGRPSLLRALFTGRRL